MRLFNEAAKDGASRQPKVVMLILDDADETKDLIGALDKIERNGMPLKQWKAVIKLKNLCDGAEVY